MKPNETKKQYFQRLDESIQEAISKTMMETKTLRKKRKLYDGWYSGTTLIRCFPNKTHGIPKQKEPVFSKPGRGDGKSFSVNLKDFRDSVSGQFPIGENVLGEPLFFDS